MVQSTTSPQAVQQGILQALYALFLGGIITAVITVGIVTFYPQPTLENDVRLDELQEREDELRDCSIQSDCPPPADYEQQLEEIHDEQDRIYDEISDRQDNWERNVSLILISMATLLLGLSLVRWNRAIVLSNGLLLGGLFTMVGGIGMTIASGQGASRFVLLMVAAAITIALGYLRFARNPAPSTTYAAAGSPADAELAQRIAALEARFDDLRRALG